jgi:type I restriction enzyme S subunit
MRSGWQWKRLCDFAAAVSTGPFGSLLHKSDYVDDGVPLVNPINIVGDRIVPDPTKLIDEATTQRLSAYILEEGDIVVGRRGEIGRCAIIGPEESGWVCGTGCFFVRPLPSIDSQFLAHLIRSNDYREKLENASTGATMKNLSNTALGDLLIAVPPLPEQQRIVGILDEAFDGIAIAKVNAEKNLRNTRALFESHLQSVFTQGGEGWPLKKLGELCDQITDGTHNSPPYVESGIPMLDSKHVNAGFAIDDGEPEKFITRETDELLAKRCKPRAGDILISSRGTIGKIAIVRNGQDFNIMGNMILIRLPDGVSREFAAFYLYSKARHIELIARGAAQKGLYLNQIRDYAIPLPTPWEQAEVGKRLDLLDVETRHLESLYQRKLYALDALKEALLHRAFSGQL